MPEIIIGFRPQIKDAVTEFLKQQGFADGVTEEAILDLVVGMANITEEGKLISPQALLCDDIGRSIHVVGCSDKIILGAGPKESQTLAKALKVCAPISDLGWPIYIQRETDRFEYGVIRQPSSPVATSIRDTILSLDTQDSPLIYLSQGEKRVVEIVAPAESNLSIILSGIDPDTKLLSENLNLLSSICCSELELSMIEKTTTYLNRALREAMQNSHGTLLAVIEQGGLTAFSDETDGGSILDPIVSFPQLAAEFSTGSSDSLAKLRDHARLLAGMVACDGIVLIDKGCRIRGYNYFLVSTETNASGNTHGGARRRAFNKLSTLVDSHKIAACFFLSSDGASEYYEGQ